MKTCSTCGQLCPHPANFCNHCGKTLAGTLVMPRNLVEDYLREVEDSLGAELPTEPQTLLLTFPRQQRSLKLRIQQNLILGRCDGNSSKKPDVDLSPFAAYSEAVSRCHARISRYPNGILTICDLGSSNGTSLNGEGLSPYHAYRLVSGDQILLGQMLVRVFYTVASQQAGQMEMYEVTHLPIAK